MWFRHLHLVTLLTALAVSFRPGNALAWVESSIRSHVTTVELARDGKAHVSHELVLKVRGGPLKAFDVDGVDDDAQLNPDAKVTLVRSGQRSEWPLLLHKSDDGAVTLEVDDKNGLKSGVYSFQFSYRSDFVKRDLLQQRGAAVHLAWVGPRLKDGVDSVKAIFRIPKGDTAPRLPQAVGGSGEEFDLESGGLLVSQMLRGADKDELELVRAHVAKGEPAVWLVQASARSFDAFTPPTTLDPTVGAAQKELPSLKLRWLLIALLVALVYALVVAVKWQLSRKAALAKVAEPRALIPLPNACRAALSGMSLAGALLMAMNITYPTLAGALLVISMLLASQLPPRIRPTIRGPGSWIRLDDDQAFQQAPVIVPGRCFDSGSLLGFGIFASCLSGFLGLAVWQFPTAPYHALLAMLGSACLVPIFCTGRSAELPPDPVARPRRFFSSLARRLRQEVGCRVTALARLPEGQALPDELRLLIEPEHMPQGLLALELGLEYQVGLGAVVDLPCLVVRAEDDSPAYYALPRSVTWSRGRTSDERVTLLRPKLPTRAMCAQLTREVVATLRTAALRTRPQAVSPRRLDMSVGKRLETSKGSMVLPSQRM